MHRLLLKGTGYIGNLTKAQEILRRINSEMEPQNQEEMQKKLVGFMEAVVGEAQTSANQEQRKTITAMDIVRSLKKNQGEFLYGTKPKESQTSTITDPSGKVQTLPKNLSE